MQDRIYSIKEISEIVVPVARDFGAERVSVFGSYARGEATPSSDIDLLLEKGKINDLFILAAFQRKLQECFSIPVDVLTTGSLSDDFLGLIRKEEIAVYESQ
jgi:predicted nucleotidyltransferase